MFWEVSQNSQETNCVKVYFLVKLHDFTSDPVKDGMSTHFSPMLISIPPKKVRKPVFFIFSGGIEMEDWSDMG